MRVDKCPNCGAFLPAPVPGQTRVECQYCHIEARVTGYLPLPAMFRKAPPPFLGGEPPPASPKIAVAIFVLVMLGVGAAVIFARSMASPGTPSSWSTATATGTATSQSRTGTFGKVDVLGSLADATAEATRLASDARLVSIRAPFVGVEGQTDLALGSDALNFIFVSPSRSVVPPGRPVGADVRLECLVYVSWMRSFHSATLTGMSRESCRQPVVRPPTCKVGEVWKRAIAAGAPTGAVATMTFEAVSAAAFHHEGLGGDFYDRTQPVEGVWNLSVTDGSKSLFRRNFADDCGGVTAAAQAPTPEFKAAVDKIVGNEQKNYFWSCPARVGIDRAKVRAHLVIPTGGMHPDVKTVEAQTFPRALSAAKQAELVKCLQQRFDQVSFPAPGAPTPVDVEITVGR